MKHFRQGHAFISNAVLLALAVTFVLLAAAPAMAEKHEATPTNPAELAMITPGFVWVFPFAMILLAIALLPLIPHVSHWWERNSSKLLVSLALAAITCAYYLFRGYGFAGAEAGMHSVEQILHHAVISDFIPFIVLLFSLYTISGGIRVTGDIPAHPITNAAFLFFGAAIASVVGTTGASMLLIRPLLQVNSERKNVAHTVVFFIFLVSNIGGSLLPVGDPPLFLGYLRGVPFLWTLHILPQWAVATGALIAAYLIFDTIMYRREPKTSITMDESRHFGFKIRGRRNILLLLGVVFAVAALVPGQKFPGTNTIIPDIHLREIAQLLFAAISFAWTPKHIHRENHFNFTAIGEVACLFIGIFITMQAPIEILKLKGEALGVTSPLQFFWASGVLSSFLDNAPTYVVFFELAGSLHHVGDVPLLHNLMTANGSISLAHLTAISCGSVFMGANTYIGNGPNFLVKSIAESRGIKMPSFFGYMVYSGFFLIPLFMLISVIFFI
jgi:Na+/H+ antiporter NhaD/arsenite permease-like protein